MFGSGKNTKGQLGFKHKGKSNKWECEPVEIKISEEEEIQSIHCGSLYSMVRTTAKKT